jgi:hypothetical protein
MVVLRTKQDYVVYLWAVVLFVSGHYGSSPRN